MPTGLASWPGPTPGSVSPGVSSCWTVKERYPTWSSDDEKQSGLKAHELGRLLFASEIAFYLVDGYNLTALTAVAKSLKVDQRDREVRPDRAPRRKRLRQ
jgi:hypothetical protein